MKIPDVVKIGCFDYKVVWKDRIFHGNDECYGLCNKDELFIELKNDLKNNPQRLVEVFIHECIHGIEESYSVELGEEKVSVLGMAIYGLIKDNNLEFISCQKKTSKSK